MVAKTNKAERSCQIDSHASFSRRKPQLNGKFRGVEGKSRNEKKKKFLRHENVRGCLLYDNK